MIVLSSPHEKRETVDHYSGTVADRAQTGAWNFAGALQPQSESDPAGPATYIAAVIEQFDPERVRICLLSPDRDGDEHDLRALRAALRSHHTEPIVIDGSVDVENGDPEGHDLFLADFFDFT